MKQGKFNFIFYIIIALLLLILAAMARAQTVESQPVEITASGGNYTLVKTVVAGGGNETSQLQMNLGGTSGQTIAGIRSDGGNFSLYSGFWTAEDYAPTASNAVAGGMIKTADGRGVKNAQVTVTFPNGQTRTVTSTTFGYYRFPDIPVGETYIFTISAKRLRFLQPTQIRTIIDDTQDINFIAFGD